jgi:hypothetical protein
MAANGLEAAYLLDPKIISLSKAAGRPQSDSTLEDFLSFSGFK